MISTVAVGTDGSATAAEAVAQAAEVARRFGAKLVLLSAFEDSPGERNQVGASEEVQWTFSSSARVREILARTSEELKRDGLDCSVRADEGEPADVLLRLVEECDADLLVIGNRGMKRRVLGSVPNTLTHRSPCTVVVVKTT